MSPQSTTPLRPVSAAWDNELFDASNLIAVRISELFSLLSPILINDIKKKMTKNGVNIDVDLGIRQGSTDSEKDSFYMDLDKGIDSDIELESEKCHPSTDTKHSNSTDPNPLPKLKNVAKAEKEDNTPDKINDSSKAVEEMPVKPAKANQNAAEGQSKLPKPPTSPNTAKASTSQPPSAQAPRKSQRPSDLPKENKGKQAPDKSVTNPSKVQSSKPRTPTGPSNVGEHPIPATPTQNRIKKPSTPNPSGGDDRSRMARPRQSPSTNSLEQMGKRPTPHKDPRANQQRPPGDRYEGTSNQAKSPLPKKTSPSASPALRQQNPSPNQNLQLNRRSIRGPPKANNPEETNNAFERLNDTRHQPHVNYQNSAEPMSEAPRRIRRQPPPKSPAAISRQNHSQNAPPQAPANGRIRHKRTDATMASNGPYQQDDSGLWMTQTSTGQAETNLGNDGTTQELLSSKISIRNDLCGSCASLASQRGGSTENLKPLAWRAGIDGMITILSGMYGKVLIVMGISFPLAEVIAHKLPAAFYEGFYLYLYGLSLAFVCYIYLFVIGPEEGLLCCKRKLDAQKVKPSNYSQTGSFYLRIGAVVFGIASMIYSGLEFGQFFEFPSNSYCYSVMQALTPCFRMAFTFIQLYFIFLNSKLYIRKSRSICKFGLMHLVATNICVWLHILVQESVHQIVLNWEKHNGVYFEGIIDIYPITTQMPYVTATSSANVSITNTTSLLEFPPNISSTTNLFNSTSFDEVTTEMTTSSELTTWSKIHELTSPILDINNDSYKFNSSLSTDVNVMNSTNYTLPSIINGSDTFDNSTNTSESASYIHFLSHACRHNSVIGRLVNLASPFLFPCAIEYSLICASILYRMWINIQKKPCKPQHSGSTSSISGSRQNRDYYQVDCSHANRGLFLGIFILVVSIIGLVLFYVLVDEPNYREIAIFELHVCELTLYFFAMVAVLIASIQVRKLKYDPFRNLDLDTTLLIVSQSGLYLHCIFRLISSHFTLQNNLNSVLSVLTSLIILIQATIQTVFILDATRRNCNTEEEMRRKPARELVTFLLVCNLSMWIINILENHKADSNPVHLKFYGFWAWTIISHITTPLIIFYRFHSTVCLCEIWKKMYKPSKEPSYNVNRY